MAHAVAVRSTLFGLTVMLQMDDHPRDREHYEALAASRCSVLVISVSPARMMSLHDQYQQQQALGS